MENLKQLAVVLFFNKGWGFAELQSDRTSVFLHHTDIASKKILHEGDIISCVVAPNDHPKHPFRGTLIEIVDPVNIAPKAEATPKAVQS
jgi:hypothetical protein